MPEMPLPETHILSVSSFQSLISTTFSGNINAMCWSRQLNGDFSEIISKINSNENIVVLDEEELITFQLSEAGQLAREILLNDLKLLTDYGASPIINVITNYDRDEEYSFFPTDVYSFHVDRSPVPFDTFLCTYHGASSDILPNDQAIQKVLIPEIRAQLKKLHNGPEAEFEEFLIDNFFDLHYEPKPHARPVNLGLGNIWRLAIDHPESPVPPCIHRAPKEHDGEKRLMMIC